MPNLSYVHEEEYPSKKRASRITISEPYDGTLSDRLSAMSAFHEKAIDEALEYDPRASIRTYGTGDNSTTDNTNPHWLNDE